MMRIVGLIMQQFVWVGVRKYRREAVRQH